MKHRVLSYLTVVAAILLMASCASRRSLERSPMVGGLTGEAYVEKVIAAAPEWKSVTGKVALNLDMGDKGKAKVNATVRIRKGEVIQFSVAPLLGIEVARMEITPEGLLLIDRMNKRYVEVSYAMLSGLANMELSFGVLQSLFLNELFLPGKNVLDADDVKRSGSYRTKQEYGCRCVPAKNLIIHSIRAPIRACWRRPRSDCVERIMCWTGTMMILVYSTGNLSRSTCC